MLKYSTGIAILLALAWAAPAAQAEDAQGLMEKVRSKDIEVRYAARTAAPLVGVSAVEPLAASIDEAALPAVADAAEQRYRHEVAITARIALEKLVHHAARPGAEAERALVAAAIAKSIAAASTPKARRELLHLASSIVTCPDVPAVAKCLSDADASVRETARYALERIPGPASIEALISAAKALGADREDWKSDLLFSLGKKGDPAAIAPLGEVASSSSGKVRLAALAALSHLGAAEAAAPAFMTALGEGDTPARASLWNEALRLADEVALARKIDESRMIYRAVLEHAALEHQRERALFQLCSRGGDLDAILIGLVDASERVRRSAVERMSGLQGEAVNKALLAAYEGAKPEARAALLRVLAERDKVAATALLGEAEKSADPELKLTALDIQDKLADPSLEALFLATAENGSPAIRPVATKGCLLLAKQKLGGGDKAGALPLYSKALATSSVDGQRSEALQGLIVIGDPRSIDQVATLLRDPVLGGEASKGYVVLATRLAEAGDKDKAEKLLVEVITGDFPREVRNQAADVLRKMGRDPQKGVREAGLVVDWWLLTPIQDPDGKALETEYFPEKTIDLVNEQRIGPRKFRWQRLAEISLDGRIDLLTSFRRSEKVITYAYTEVNSPKEQEVLFKMGSDDGIACWLNGQRIHLNNAARGLTLDEDVVKAKLSSGKNKILLKISNGGGTWEFAFRITDPEGRPLALPALE